MSLTTIWTTNPDQLQGKHIHQIISIAGGGRLLDDSEASREFREFLAIVQPDMLRAYADGCLLESFQDSGLALQDIVNEVGHRLDFEVEKGRYRGTKGIVGFDGIWRSDDGHAVIVEVKTTDTYKIELARLAAYRKEVISAGKLSEAKSSILIVVGRAGTEDLEAQVRGSRYAWDVRLISIRALFKLLDIKITLEDPLVVQQIRNILAPREYTRVDDIVDLVFRAAEDVAMESDVPESEAEADADEGEEAVAPVKESRRKHVDFSAECAERIERHFGRPLVKQSRVIWRSPDNAVGLLCKTSRRYVRGNRVGYWFAVHSSRYAKLFLSVEEVWVSFGCGTAEVIVLVPYSTFIEWSTGMNITTMKNGEMYWHVHIWEDNGRVELRRKSSFVPIDLSSYLLTGPT
jgi:hypothetical protein